ncbi:hypothetical protein EDB89DRAFT_1904399 [Lactarius sanguifluus]|nr:hypothetical protein EDB89DRAFT_1904399 [Lactarius sanguifluus]
MAAVHCPPLSLLHFLTHPAFQVETWPTRSLRTSARVPARPAVFDATALFVPTIFDFGPLLKLDAVLPAQVDSLLALLWIFQSGALDGLHGCQHVGADTTGEYDTCMRSKESAGSPTICVNVSTSMLAPPAQTLRMSSARRNERVLDTSASLTTKYAHRPAVAQREH